MTNNEMIYVEETANEATEFVSWLNKNGYDAELTNDGCIATSNDFVNDLWEQYCNN